MPSVIVPPGSTPTQVLDALKGSGLLSPPPIRTSRKGKRIGRPPRIHPRLVEDVCALIAAGATHEDAAEAVGVSRATLHSWKARGREARAVMDSMNTRPADAELVYLDFLNQVERAQALGSVAVTEKLRELAMGQAVRSVTIEETEEGGEIRTIEFVPPSTRALTFMLERRYGWRQAVELSGPDLGPIPVEVEVSARDLVRKRLASMADKIAAPDEDESLPEDVDPA